MNEYTFVVAGIAAAFGVAGFIVGYFLGKRRRESEPKLPVLGAGERVPFEQCTMVVVMVTHTGDKIIADLQDFNSWERLHRYDG